MTTTTATARAAQAVTAEMEAAGVSQNALSDRTLIPRSTLLRRLAGESSFTVDELEKISSAMSVPFARLLGLE